MPRNFDGSTGYLQANTPAVTGFPCSICAWIDPDTVGAAMHVAGVADGNPLPIIRLHIDDTGKPIAQCRSDAGDQSNAVGTTTLNTTSTEYCLVGTFASNGTAKIYVFTGGSGGLEGTGSAPGSTTITPGVTSVGVFSRSGLEAYFDGRIGHVAFWNAELDSTQAAQLGSGTNPEDVAGGPVHYWTVDTNADPENDEILVSSINLGVNGTCPRTTPDFPVNPPSGPDVTLAASGSASTGGQTTPAVSTTVAL